MKTLAVIFVLAVVPALSFATIPKCSFPLDDAALESETFEEYDLEAWMLNLDTWSEAQEGTLVFSEGSDSWMTVAQENDMELEAWMLDINENTWDVQEVEQEISVEAWMTKPSTWLKTN